MIRDYKTICRSLRKARAEGYQVPGLLDNPGKANGSLVGDECTNAVKINLA